MAATDPEFFKDRNLGKKSDIGQNRPWCCARRIMGAPSLLVFMMLALGALLAVSTVLGGVIFHTNPWAIVAEAVGSIVALQFAYVAIGVTYDLICARMAGATNNALEAQGVWVCARRCSTEFQTRDFKSRALVAFNFDGIASATGEERDRSFRRCSQ